MVPNTTRHHYLCVEAGAGHRGCRTAMIITPEEAGRDPHTRIMVVVTAATGLRHGGVTGADHPRTAAIAAEVHRGSIEGAEAVSAALGDTVGEVAVVVAIAAGSVMQCVGAIFTRIIIHALLSIRIRMAA